MNLLFKIAKCAFPLFIIYLSTKAISVLSLGGVLAVVFIVALFVAMPHSYYLIAGKTKVAYSFKPGGLFTRFLGWRFFAILIRFLLAVTAVFYMLVQLSFLHGFSWVWVVLTLLVFYSVYFLVHRVVSEESVSWLVLARSSRYATWIAPTVLMIVHLLFTLFSGSVPLYDNLGQARAVQITPLVNSSSLFMREAAEWLVLAGGYEDFALGKIGFYNKLPALMLSVFSYQVIFISVCSILAFFTIPFKEYKRLLLPLTPDSELPQISAFTAGKFAAVFAIIVIMIYLPFGAWIEQKAIDNNKKVVAFRQLAARGIDAAVNVIIIGEKMYDAKLLAELNALNAISLKNDMEARKVMAEEYSRIFDSFEANVDNYLNWYYSLSGEYARIGKLLSGTIEGYMSDKFKEHLVMGVNTEKINDVYEQYKESLDIYKDSLEELKAKYEIPKEMQTNVNIEKHFAGFDNLTSPQLLAPQQRIGIGGGVGAVAGVMTAKIVQKTAFKFATKTAAKLGSSKVLGALGGTAAGAVVGSVVPGVGTTAGAVAGLGVGVASALVAEKGMLMLEDIVNRENFKAEIIDEIRSQKKEIIAVLLNDYYIDYIETEEEN